MKSFLWKLTLRLKRKPYWAQIILFYFSSFLIVICFIPLLLLAELQSESTEGPDINSWIIIILIAPFLETLVFQYFPFWFMQKWIWLKTKKGLYIIVSAMLFGLSHTYSLSYIIMAFSVGLILAYIYFFYSKTTKLAFWSTTLIHSLRNGFSFLIATYADNFN